MAVFIELDGPTIGVHCDTPEEAAAVFRELLGRRPRVEIGDLVAVQLEARGQAAPRESAPPAAAPAPRRARATRSNDRPQYGKTIAGPSKAHRIVEAFRANEGYPLEELAIECYGDSSADSVRKLKQNIMYLCKAGRLTRTGRDRYTAPANGGRS